MKRALCISPICCAFLLAAIPLAAQTIVPYPTSNLPGSSGHYTVSVNGTSVPVFSYGGYSYAWFATSGSVNVAMTYSSSISSYKILPTRLNIPSTRSGNTVTVAVASGPKKFVFKPNGTSEDLFIMADPLESGAPASSGSGIYNVVTGYGANNSFGSDAASAINSAISAANGAGGGIVYVPAGHYKLGSGSIHLLSNVKLYLAPGALLQVASGYGGGFHNSSAIYTETDNNAEIYGRGVIYGTGVSQGTFFWLFSSENQTSFRVQDVMFLDSQTTGMRLQCNGCTVENTKIITLPGRLADGIDMESASNITIDNDLILSTDDNTEFGTGTDSLGIIRPFNNINITNNLMANLMTGHTFSIAPHTSNSSSSMSNITYNNNDSIDTDAVIAIYPFGGTPVSNVLFENFGAENIRGRPFEIWGGDCTSWGPGNCGSPVGVIGAVTNVTIANTNFYTVGSQDSQLYASSSGSPINGVHFNGDTMAGTAITSASAMHLEINSGNITNLTFSASAPSTPIISSFSASPSAITAGSSSTLSWSISGATSLSISGGVGTVTGTSKSVSPATTTTYTITATNSSGSSSAQATVTVNPTGSAPTISSFSASPASISSGSSSTLSWTSSGATSLSLSGGIGTVTGTSQSVSPTATTTYVLTATNSFGSVTKSATVTVVPAAPPTISSFTASPATINRFCTRSGPCSSTLSWTTSGASTLSINQGVGTVTGTSQSVSPTTTTTYVLTATNGAGSVTSSATVTVNPVVPPTQLQGTITLTGNVRIQ